MSVMIIGHNSVVSVGTRPRMAKTIQNKKTAKEFSSTESLSPDFQEIGRVSIMLLPESVQRKKGCYEQEGAEWAEGPEVRLSESAVEADFER